MQTRTTKRMIKPSIASGRVSVVAPPPILITEAGVALSILLLSGMIMIIIIDINVVEDGNVDVVVEDNVVEDNVVAIVVVGIAISVIAILLSANTRSEVLISVSAVGKVVSG